MLYCVALCACTFVKGIAIVRGAGNWWVGIGPFCSLNCLFLSHPFLFCFCGSQTHVHFFVVLDGPCRFSLIWYLAVLPMFFLSSDSCSGVVWRASLWFVFMCGNSSIQIGPFVYTSIHVCADRKFRLVACRVGRGSQLCVPDWPFYNRHPVKWLDQIPTSAPEKKNN